MPRTLKDGQRCQVLVVDATTGDATVVLERDDLLLEAPNWSPDGRWLVLNGDGVLWRVPVDAAGGATGDLERVPLAGVPEINNDHVVAPDQGSVFLSARDGHLYEVPFDGGEGRRVTREHPEGRSYKHYLHGISPDGATLAVVAGALPEAGAGPEAWRTDVTLVAVADGAVTPVTADGHPDDGPEFSPDGRWIWFNSERRASGRPAAAPGHAQLFRVGLDGGDLVQVTDDELVDWFPHVSPDGSTLLWLGYPPGTLGHPEDLDVVLRTLPLGGDGLPVPGELPRDLLRLPGGQGTVNVPGWSPDSARFACVAYPFG